MAEPVRFEVLGPLRAWHGERVLSLGAPQRRAVLAVLLLQPNRAISREQIIEAVWGSAAPAYAVNLVHKHVSALRRALEPARPGRQPSRLLTWSEGRYLLSVPAGCLDLTAFDGEVHRAHVARAGGDLRAASAALHAATRLWRGSACDGLAGPFLDAERGRLTERRISTIEERMEVDLALGEPGDLAAELRLLVAAHPLRERLRSLLMLALYRSGRRAEALAAFQDARRHLVDELGVEPAAELQQLHQRILAADPSLTRPAEQVTVRQPPAGPVPAQLPADVYGFTGRAAELAGLDGLLSAPNGRSTAVGIAVLCGTAGVGKTALAVHWAHRARAGFPDGQLYVNLRGYDVDRPVPVGEVLTRFLVALGVSGQDVPLDIDERATRYRTEIVDRRMLVVLDNAASVDQVRLLMPGTAACRVLVTSRDRLTGLVALHGGRRIAVDPLPPDDATALLRTLIGARVDADPATAATLAGQCARLPLALRIVVELAIARPATSLAELVAELADRQRRLHLLDAGDDVRAAIPAVFSWSYLQLPPAAARAFRFLGLHPGPDFDAYAVATLVDTDLASARQQLKRLARAHLVQPDHTGRYALHDLLHAYAAELALAEADADRSAALSRLLDYYTWGTATATRALFPVESLPQPTTRPPATPAPAVADPAAARAWLESERQVLLAAGVHAARQGWPTHAVALARTLHRYLEGSHYTDALAVHSEALAAARRVGDESGQAHSLTNLGAVYRTLGRYEVAIQHQQEALELHRRTGDGPGEARTLSNLGILAHRQGDHERAAGHLHEALRLYRNVGDRYGEAAVLTNLGGVHTRPGHYPEAVRHLAAAVVQFRSVNGTVGEASALSNLGDAHRQMGRYLEAAEHLRRAVALFRDTNHHFGLAGALTNLGQVHTLLRQHDQAIDCHRESLAVMRTLGDPYGEATTLNGLGEALLAADQPAEVRAHHAAALAIAVQIGDPFEQARARAGLAATPSCGSLSRPPGT